MSTASSSISVSSPTLSEEESQSSDSGNGERGGRIGRRRSVSEEDDEEDEDEEDHRRVLSRDSVLTEHFNLDEEFEAEAVAAHAEAPAPSADNVVLVEAVAVPVPAYFGDASSIQRRDREAGNSQELASPGAPSIRDSTRGSESGVLDVLLGDVFQSGRAAAGSALSTRATPHSSSRRMRGHRGASIDEDSTTVLSGGDASTDVFHSFSLSPQPSNQREQRRNVPAGHTSSPSGGPAGLVNVLVGDVFHQRDASDMTTSAGRSGEDCESDNDEGSLLSRGEGADDQMSPNDADNHDGERYGARSRVERNHRQRRRAEGEEGQAEETEEEYDENQEDGEEDTYGDDNKADDDEEGDHSDVTDDGHLPHSRDYGHSGGKGNTRWMEGRDSASLLRDSANGVELTTRIHQASSHRPQSPPRTSIDSATRAWLEDPEDSAYDRSRTIDPASPADSATGEKGNEEHTPPIRHATSPLRSSEKGARRERSQRRTHGATASAEDEETRDGETEHGQHNNSSSSREGSQKVSFGMSARSNEGPSIRLGDKNDTAHDGLYAAQLAAAHDFSYSDSHVEPSLFAAVNAETTVGMGGVLDLQSPRQRGSSLEELWQRAPEMGSMLVRATSFRVPVADSRTSAEFDNEPHTVEPRRSFFTVAFWLSIVQILVVVYQLWYYGFASLALNPLYGPPPEVLDYFGAKNAAKIIYWDEGWRLVTSVMLHAGILHLCINEMIQLRLGIFLETDFGTMQFILVYCCGALYGQICSVIALPGQVSVGASGALMGLYGAWVVVLIVRWPQVPREQWCMRNIQLSIVLICIAVTMFFSFVSYVDWAAHGGGLIGGTLVACAIFVGECRCKAAAGKAAVVAVRLIMVFVIVCVFVGTFVLMYETVQPPRNLLHYCVWLRSTQTRRYSCVVDV